MPDNKVKKSIIKLDQISLERLTFKKKSNALRRSEIPPSSLRIGVTIFEREETYFESVCDIGIYDEDQRGDFELSLTYKISASILDPQHKEALEKFAKYGSPFNALVFAREAVADITFRAFGKSATIPLLDVHSL